MFSWRRQRRARVAADPVEQFDRDVLACTDALGRELSTIGRRYSVQVLVVGLAMQLKATIALCRREGHLSESQANRLIELLLRAEG